MAILTYQFVETHRQTDREREREREERERKRERERERKRELSFKLIDKRENEDGRIGWGEAAVKSRGKERKINENLILK